MSLHPSPNPVEPDAADAKPDIEGDLRRAIELLDAAVILLKPAPRDPLYAYEPGAIFAVVSSARDFRQCGNGNVAEGMILARIPRGWRVWLARRLCVRPPDARRPGAVPGPPVRCQT